MGARKTHPFEINTSQLSNKLMNKDQTSDGNDPRGKYILIKDAENSQGRIFDKPLPCCGCGIGWFSFLLGFFFPLAWYFATILYFGSYYRKNPRERAGLAASAIAALVCSVVAVITAAAIVF